jgi:glycosyltransferase involved in cell wall biosynthesis
MVQALLDSRHPGLELISVPFRFSRSMADMGRPGLGKVTSLVRAILGTWRARLRGATDLYYCVAGAERFPLWRDAAFLASCRWGFKRTIYHFHAGGASEYLRHAPAWERRVLTLAIGAPSVGIKLSPTSPLDPEYFKAARVVVVPNGLGSTDDELARQPIRSRADGGPIRFLYVGRLSAAKGCFRTIDLVRDLRDRGHDVSVDLVGESDGPETSARLIGAIDSAGLTDAVRLRGPLMGDEKWAAFGSSDFFVFLSEFEHENVPLTIIESMMNGLPVIASRWRGIPGLLDNGALGTLVDLDDWPGLVEEVTVAISDPRRCTDRAERARRAWQERHTSEAYTTALVHVLSERAERASA